MIAKNIIEPRFNPETGQYFLPPPPESNGQIAPKQVGGISTYGWWHDGYGVPELHQLGFLGERLYIVVNDSGVNPLDRFKGAVIAREDFTGEGIVDDLHSHGTFIASQLVASHEVAGYKGTTPKALIHSKRVLDSTGFGGNEMIFAALESCLAIPIEEGRFYMMNNSFGGWYSKDIHEVIKELIAKGWHIFNAAGNFGQDAMGYPAANKEGFAVGASNGLNVMADFNSVPIEGQDLDILSCGVNIAGYVKDGRQSNWSGSSMACPDALGKWGLLLEMDYKAARKIYAMPPIREELAIEQFVIPQPEGAKLKAGVLLPPFAMDWIMNTDKLLPNEVEVIEDEPPVDDGDDTDTPRENPNWLTRNFKTVAIIAFIAFIIVVILGIIFGT